MRARARFAISAILLSIVLRPAGLTALDIGKAATEFSVTTVDGGRFVLLEAQKTHSAIVVLFLSTLCPYSNYYNDLVRDLSSDFGKKGVLFVGVNSGTSESIVEMTAHAREHGHAFPFVKDPESRIAEIFDARRTPEVFVLDRDGKLRYRGRIASKISSPDLKNALDALLAGRPIHPSETKAFGCSIPRG